MVPNIAVDEAAASWMSWAEKPPLSLHVAGACRDAALRPWLQLLGHCLDIVASLLRVAALDSLRFAVWMNEKQNL